MSGWASLAAALVTTVLTGADPRVLLTFQDAEITESSAIVDGGDVVYTVNDSGDSARVFVVDKHSGATVGVTTYDGRDPVDVEALAAGPGGTLWVGDIGDNERERSHITVHRIRLPGPGDHRVSPTSYELVYRDGPRDAEALLVHPKTGRVYVVSKGLLGGTVYVAPRHLRSDRTNVLWPVGRAGPLVTDGVFLPDGRHLLLRGYTTATVLTADDLTPVAQLELPEQEQGEGIAVAGDTVLVSTEGEHAPVHVLPLPRRVVAAMRAQPPPSAEPTPAPEPVAQQPADPWGGDAVPFALAAAWIAVLAAVVLRWRRIRRPPRG